MRQELPFQRTETLFGADAMRRLGESTVALFGVGGVGGHCAEALARSGVGGFLLVDRDRVAVSNLNRQAVALHSTLGRLKVDVMRERILDINPEARVETLAAFYLPEDSLGVWDRSFSLVIDAVDTVTAKVDLAVQAEKRGIPCVSCMGAGNKLNPALFEAADLYETSVCPLSRAMRKLCREKGVARLRVVYSKEPPAPRLAPPEAGKGGHSAPGSVAYVTASAGLLLASEAVSLLLGLSA